MDIVGLSVCHGNIGCSRTLVFGKSTTFARASRSQTNVGPEDLFGVHLLWSSIKVEVKGKIPASVWNHLIQRPWDGDTVMHLEVKVALNFIVSYLYNKLPRRRADLFGEELERILMSRFEGHWYPEAPLRGSAFRCIQLGAPRDPVVELAAKRSGLDTEEVRANVPAELSVWIDPYEVSYQIGEKGLVKVLYLEDPPGLGCDGEAPESVMREAKGDVEAEENKSAGFNPDAQVFVPISSQASPTLLPSLCSSPPPLPTSCHGLFSYPSSSTPPELAPHSSNTSTPSPPSALPYLSTQQPARPQPITFTTASFAATKFGSTKMKKSSGGVPPAGPPVPRMLSRSPPLPAPELLKHKPLSLSLHSLGGTIPSQLSPNAKEFIYPGSPGQLYFDSDTPPIQAHTSPFQPPHAVSNQPPFDPFSSPPPTQNVGIIGSGGGPISYAEKPPFVDGLGNYNLQYPSPSFQPVVLAN